MASKLKQIGFWCLCFGIGYAFGLIGVAAIVLGGLAYGKYLKHKEVK